MSSPDETSLVRSARAGDRAAFSVLVDLYWERIRRWLFALSGWKDVDDLTQEVFLKAWRQLPGLREEGCFRAWLFQIARRMAEDVRRCRRPKTSQPMPTQLSSTAANPHAILVEAEGRALLQQALDRLPPRYRAAFLLWTQETLSYGEIADILQTTELTARWLVCKARAFLLRELEPYLNDAEGSRGVGL